MTRAEIIEKLKDILLSADDRNRETIETCDERSNLALDFGFTSISTLYMVIAIEEVFSIRFDNVGMSDFETLGDVVDYIEKKLS